MCLQHTNEPVLIADANTLKGEISVSFSGHLQRTLSSCQLPAVGRPRAVTSDFAALTKSLGVLNVHVKHLEAHDTDGAHAGDVASLRLTRCWRTDEHDHNT